MRSDCDDPARCWGGGTAGDHGERAAAAAGEPQHVHQLLCHPQGQDQGAVGKAKDQPFNTKTGGGGAAIDQSSKPKKESIRKADSRRSGPY
jgi:hypothetical protein